MSSFSVNPERVQTVDMVSYFSAGTSVGVKSGNPDNINADDLCGKAVGVQAGTVQVDDIAARNQKCTDEGKPAIQVTELQAQTDVTLALTANRIVAMLADSPIVDYAAKTTEGAIEAVGTPYDTAPYGIVLDKGQTEFAQAVQGAVQSLIDDGTYLAILDKYGRGQRRDRDLRDQPHRLTVAAPTDDTTAGGTGSIPGRPPPRSRPCRSGTRGGGPRSRCSPSSRPCSSTRS